MQEKVQSSRMLARPIAEKYSLTPEEENILAKMVADKLVELEAGKSPAPAESGIGQEGRKTETKSRIIAPLFSPREHTGAEPRITTHSVPERSVGLVIKIAFERLPPVYSWGVK